MTLHIDKLRLDFQPEQNLIAETVEQYVCRLQEASPIAPVTVRFDGEAYWLQDGFHRIAAMRALGLSIVEAEIVPGTLADMEAEWKDGLRRFLAELELDKPAPKGE